MIDFLDGIYPGWRRKLENMSFNQLQAIYNRLYAKQKDVQMQRIRELEYKRLLATETKPTSYLCTDCASTYEADNPELQECRYCGSPNVRRNIYD